MTRNAAVLPLLLAFVFYGGGPLLLRGEEKAESLAMCSWRVPPGFISEADPSDKNGFRKPLKGFKSKENPYKIQYDATEFLKAQGIDFPPGSDAIYDQDANMLIVRNTAENLDLVDTIASGCVFGSYENVVVEIATFECALPVGKNPLALEWPTYSALAQLPATDIEMLDRVSANAKSGQRVPLKNISTTASAKASPPPSVEEKSDADSWDIFLDGEFGTIADIEPIIGPDGVTLDANINYRFRLPAPGDTTSKISVETYFTCWENYPVVVYVVPSPRQKGKFIVVTANVRLTNYGGWSLNRRPAATGVAEEKTAQSGD